MTDAHGQRPVRDEDPARNAAYWARIDLAVAAAPPLSDRQRAELRAIFFSNVRSTTPARPLPSRHAA
jgi:hypothetical protein